MSKTTRGVKIFRGEATIGFTYNARGRYTLVVDIQGKTGPRLAQLTSEETWELYTWLRKMIEPEPAAQTEV